MTYHSFSHRADIIRLLFELGADSLVHVLPEQDLVAVDDEEYHLTPKYTIDRPMTGAALQGHLECVQVLVDDVKVSINEPDIVNGGTALVYIVAKGQAGVVRFQLSKDASIETQEGAPDRTWYISPRCL